MFTNQKTNHGYLPENASVDELISQINKCPSGALSYELKDDNVKESNNKGVYVNIMKNGPIIINSKMVISNSDDSETATESTTAFCRCGASSNKPYCDGTHSKINFVG